MERLRVVKIGGNVVDDAAKLNSFLRDFAALPGKKILIHGGGKVATAIGGKLGIEAQMIGGRRVTDSGTLDVVTMVYAGLINKNIVATLQALGCNAMGLCGADGGFIRSVRRSAVPVDYGYVGDPVEVNARTAQSLINCGFTPVVAPVTHDAKGQLLNTNADTMAQTVATGLAHLYDVELVFCFEKRGVLDNIEDENSVIAHVDPTRFEELKSLGKVADGMLPKLENAFKATREGVSKVVICSAEAISEDNYGGTVITK